MTLQTAQRSQPNKYMVGDKVRVTATDRTGVVEGYDLDLERPPYLVRLDPRTVEEFQQPECALFHEAALERNLSPAFTVVFEVGARDVYERVLDRLVEAHADTVAGAADPQDAAHRQAKASQMAESFFQSLVYLVMRASAHDGVLHISPESHAGDCLSLLFCYERSGYHGGLVFHGERTGSAGEHHPLVGEWNIHT